MLAHTQGKQVDKGVEGVAGDGVKVVWKVKKTAVRHTLDSA